MSRLCQWYKGRPEDLQKPDQGARVATPPGQVTRTSVHAKELWPSPQHQGRHTAFVMARSCVFHVRFTKYVQAPDYGVAGKPIPFLDFTRSQVVNGP